MQWLGLLIKDVKTASSLKKEKIYQASENFKKTEEIVS